MNPKARLFRVFLVVVGFIVLFSCPAFADTFPFIFLIKDGLALQYRGTDVNGLSIFLAEKPFYHFVNWQIYENSWGYARVIVWHHPVSDPFFSPFGPIAVLIEFYFIEGLQDLNAHLALIQTPSGYQTTVAMKKNKSVRGSWLFTDGTMFGGTASDLVIGGFLVVGTPSLPQMANLDIYLYPYFLKSEYLFSFDPSPIYLRSIIPDVPIYASKELSGSFYGHTTSFNQNPPVRSFSHFLKNSYGFFNFKPLHYASHLMAVHTGGEDYYVIACSDYPEDPEGYSSQFAVYTPDNCTLSGTGQLSPYTGDAVYLPGSSVGETILSLYSWGLVLQ